MSVHYRFKSTLEYDTITIDGLHISVKDLKNSIIQQKRIGKSTDFDLRITNAQTQEVYEDENALIPKNTSLLIARIPVTAPKQKQWEGYGGNDTPPAKVDEGGPVGKAMDLASLDAPENDKIKAMMSQSTQDYDPSNYVKIRGANQVGPVPASYRCYKCYQTGHWIKDCPLGQGTDPVEIKKSTGIPHSFLIPVEGPQVPGAMMMANGQYAVSALDLQAQNQKSTGPTPVQEPKREIPEDLLCSICSDLLTDAVMIPCCGNSFCDECIRSFLLDSEEHECPDCHEKEISPATLIPNRFLRKSVANFKNTTGYEKKPVFKPKTDIPKEEPPKKEPTPPPAADAKENLKEEEKTVISEADSTEHDKNGFSKDIDLDAPKSKSEDADGPPGVSPGDSSPVHKISSKISKKDKEKSRDKERSRETEHRSHKSRRSRTASPRKSHSRRSPSYESRRISERRSNTPTRDEPPGIGNNYAPPVNQYAGQHGTNIPPPGMPPMQGHPVPMQSTGFPPNQPPPYHPASAPPNFRLPPPGNQPPPFMPAGYQGARPVFDPMVGPPGNFANNYGGRRDFGRRGRERTPPGVIDDPLTAFNRILREKDEKRARQQRLAARRSSWSRSRSRSRSFSRSPPPLRRRSRSPRRRKSRSRSRSFSMSRSRSRSYSKSPRGSPLPSLRRSPLPQARRGASGRFRSPIRSPPNRRRIDRDRIDYDRDYERGSFREKTRTRRGDSRERYYEERDHHRDYDRGRNRPAPVVSVPPSQPQPQWTGQRDAYYPPPQDQPGPGYQQNRFPQQIHRIQPDRKYPEIAPPPVVEQPPIPGLETELPPVNEFEKKKSPERKEKEKEKPANTKEVDKDRRSHRDRKKEGRSRTKTPEKWRNPSPRGTTPDKPRKAPDEKPRKRHASTESKKRDPSEDDKRKTKDKKKHREKKDDKKKKKDKKDKHHKSKKDKKEEFKQVIPKGESNEEELSEASKKKLEEKRKLREEEEKKRIAEERKKEERRLRFIEEEKLKREELIKKEEAKRKAIEEARRLLEEEEERQRLELQKQQEKEQLELEAQEKKAMDLYDEIIPEKDLATEIHEDFNINEKEDIKEETPSVEQEPITEEKPVEAEKLFDESNTKAIIEEEDLGILELHSDMDIKLDDTDILAPLPEKSKWEEDEDGQTQINTPENKEPNDSKSKVSNEVLKRAENVIFARAINSIRSMDIKKSSGERSKISFDEKEDIKKEPPVVEKPKLSIKQRLGIKVDEPDPKVNLIDRTPSPFNRRRIVIDTGNKRHSRPNQRDRERHRNDKSSDKTSRRSRTEDKDKRKRTRSRSESDEHKRKKREKKVRKPKKEDNKKAEVEEKPKVIEKRKPTLDEANFEPDYDDLDTHEEVSETEKDSAKKKAKEAHKTESEDSSSSDSSSSSSEEDRKRKKRKSKKKRKRKDSSSSESDSSSESSDSDRDRKKRKHKKPTKKKKKKSKHK